MKTKLPLALPLSLAALLSLSACFVTVSPVNTPSASPSAAPTATPSPTAVPTASPPLGTGGFQQAAGCPDAASSNLVVNGGFETPDAQNAYVSLFEDFTGWKLAAGDVDITHSDYWQPAAGNQSLDLNGGQPGTISQELVTKAGMPHRITLCMAGNPEGDDPVKRLDVLWNDNLLGQLSFDTSGKTNEQMGWVSYTVLLPGNLVTGRSRLTLRSLSNGSYGPVVDNVSVYLVKPE